MESLRAEIAADTPVVIQRVGATTRADDVVTALAGASPHHFEVRGEPFTAAGPAVVDLRGQVEFDGWDERRGTLESRREPLVLLVDVQTAKAMLRACPQTVFWAGGVRLPDPPTVRAALTPDEVRVGRENLSRAVAEQPALQGRAGESVAVDLASGRLYFRAGAALPLAVARAELDQGIVYLGRVPG